MKVGIPKEIKNNENRVGMTPAGVAELVRKGQLLFTYFHFACEKELTDAMLKSGAVCLAYDNLFFLFYNRV